MSEGKMMSAVRFHGREDLRFEQVPEPECGKGQIKIKPAWCGICGRVRK
jgi:threonine dehydrogenase-like Zn-dependent dehydrogenase